MPILDITFFKPLRSLDEVLDRLPAVDFGSEDSLGSQSEQASRARDTDHRFGPMPPSRAKWCTSRAEPVSTTRPALVRSPLAQVWWIADKASNRGNRDALAIDEPVGHYDDRIARAHRVFG